MNSNPLKQMIEVEAKFLGGEPVYQRIVAWLAGRGFAVERKALAHRVHVYFDDNGELRIAGCRLRCVIASGEWCRYDFKADDPTGRGETLELSSKSACPKGLEEVIGQFLGQLPVGRLRATLQKCRGELRPTLAMTGTHVKAIASRDGLKLEVSWDTLCSAATGNLLSEIEVELLAGDRAAFDQVIASLQMDLSLIPERRSKLDQMLPTVGKGVSM